MEIAYPQERARRGDGQIQRVAGGDEPAVKVATVAPGPVGGHGVAPGSDSGDADHGPQRNGDLIREDGLAIAQGNWADHLFVKTVGQPVAKGAAPRFQPHGGVAAEADAMHRDGEGVAWFRAANLDGSGGLLA